MIPIAASKLSNEQLVRCNLNGDMLKAKLPKFNVGDHIQGIFYEEDFVKHNKKHDIYQIKRVIKSRKQYVKLEYFVKWNDNPESMN
ncbi:uncharacterized protein B4U80_01018 [Leptotrombidium deliense]|uniref:Chromo domain-containing protein n=1 Tax=Leptotrombidium deliense TaxID=299467 RepID=A0A443RUY0_9ACAR|nr:uncharacterized protein B4U80_01018 [Leptotrombidium deliense]